jgi:putative membrane protein
LHLLMGGWLRAFAEDRNRRPAGFFRIVNELPTLLMILIVVLVVVKPF